MVNRLGDDRGKGLGRNPQFVPGRCVQSGDAPLPALALAQGMGDDVGQVNDGRPGRIVGQVRLDSLVRRPDSGPDWSSLRVRLTLDPLEGQRARRPWRFFDGSEDGSFELQWLDLPSGPYQLQAWLDKRRRAVLGRADAASVRTSATTGLASPSLSTDLKGEWMALTICHSEPPKYSSGGTGAKCPKSSRRGWPVTG